MLRFGRREWLLLAASGGRLCAGSGKVVVRVNVMLDLGAHGGKGLTAAERLRFEQLQAAAAREFGVSGIQFDLQIREDAFLREQGYSEVPDRFLVRNRINLFVTQTLKLDIDRDRTGGASSGPRPHGPGFGGDPYYKTFLGLREASDTTLAHEYAHHFVLDTKKRPGMAANFWSDLRNDYWLWRQRHGAAIEEFRACAGSVWAQS